MTILQMGRQRSAPWGFRLEALFGEAGGWILGIALPLLFMKSIAPSAVAWVQYHGKMQSTTGVVSSVSDTGRYAGRRSGSPEKIFCISYTFTTSDGSTHYGKPTATLLTTPILLRVHRQRSDAEEETHQQSTRTTIRIMLLQVCRQPPVIRRISNFERTILPFRASRGCAIRCLNIQATSVCSSASSCSLY